MHEKGHVKSCRRYHKTAGAMRDVLPAGVLWYHVKSYRLINMGLLGLLAKNHVKYLFLSASLGRGHEWQTHNGEV